MTLLFPFSEIPEHGVQIEITDPSWFPEHLREAVGSVSAHILLLKKSENKIELKGMVKSVVSLECDRCLEQYRYTFASDLQLLVELADHARHWRLQDMEIGKGDLDTIQVEKPVVDLGDILRQQILLGMPDKQLCSENCLGLCKHCGTNLNVQRCSCEDKTAGSPFAVLASLKKKHKD